MKLLQVYFVAPLDFIARGSYQRLEIRLANDQYSIPFGDKFLGLPLLYALLVPCKLCDVLVTDNQNRCLLCYAGRNLTTNTGRKVCRFASR